MLSAFAPQCANTKYKGIHPILPIGFRGSHSQILQVEIWSIPIMKLLLVPYLLALLLPIISTYKIENCSSSEIAIDHAITLAQTTMIRPLFDLRRGLLSSHGYTAMYKSNDFTSFLHGLMTNILHLTTIHAAGRDLEPTFVCATSDMEQKFNIGYDPLERCAETQATSFWAKDTAVVFLCPSFKSLAFQPVLSPGGPQDIYCPVVLKNMFVGQSDPLVKYQSYDLVHQLAHLYLQDGGLTDQTEPKEVVDWNSCVGLGWASVEGELSVRNPFNLVYYVACKWGLEGMRSFWGADGRQLSIRNARRCRIRSSLHSQGVIKSVSCPVGTWLGVRPQVSRMYDCSRNCLGSRTLPLHQGCWSR